MLLTMLLCDCVREMTTNDNKISVVSGRGCTAGVARSWRVFGVVLGSWSVRNTPLSTLLVCAAIPVSRHFGANRREILYALWTGGALCTSGQWSPVRLPVRLPVFSLRESEPQIYKNTR